MNIKLQVQHQRIQGVKQVSRLIVEKSRRFVYLDLDFDEEWDDLTTTVIFTNDHCRDKSIALLWTGQPLEVPEETLVDGTLRISCVGVGNNGLYLTTKYMSDGIQIFRSGETDGQDPGSAVPGLWEQVLSAVGPLGSLDTVAKGNIVVAVNEILGRSIQGIEQTLFAETDGGVNEFTITLFDGSKTVLQVLNGSKGEAGNTPFVGENGNWWVDTTDTGVPATGPAGAPFTYEMFTADQLEALRGPTGLVGPVGPKGDKGDPFMYSDFTAAQLEALRGPQGYTGATGAKGDKGDPFVYSDFTAEQLEALRGPTGATGPSGTPGATGNGIKSITIQEVT